MRTAIKRFRTLAPRFKYRTTTFHKSVRKYYSDYTRRFYHMENASYCSLKQAEHEHSRAVVLIPNIILPNTETEQCANLVGQLSKKYKHCIWDWNGTLLDDTWLCLDIMNRLLMEKGLKPLTLKEYKQLFEFPVRKYYKAIGFQIDDENSGHKFEELAAEFMMNYERRKKECTLFPLSKEVIQKLREAGISHSVLSAYKQDKLQELLDFFRVSKHFVNVVGNGDARSSYDGKREIGHLIMNNLPCDKNDLILIGDTVHDWEISKMLDIDCLLLSHGHHGSEKLKKCNVPVVHSMPEVLDVLTKPDGLKFNE